MFVEHRTVIHLEDSVFKYNFFLLNYGTHTIGRKKYFDMENIVEIFNSSLSGKRKNFSLQFVQKKKLY